MRAIAERPSASTQPDRSDGPRSQQRHGCNRGNGDRRSPQRLPLGQQSDDAQQRQDNPSSRVPDTPHNRMWHGPHYILAARWHTHSTRLVSAVQDNDTARYRLRNDAVSWAETDDGIAVLDLKRSVYLAVNVSGASLWRRLSHGATVRELSSLLQVEFEVDGDSADTYVREFLADAARLGVCEVEQATGGLDAGGA